MAKGEKARLRGMGRPWGMYLDMVIDRIVETGLIAAPCCDQVTSPVRDGDGPVCAAGVD